MITKWTLKRLLFFVPIAIFFYVLNYRSLIVDIYAQKSLTQKIKNVAHTVFKSKPLVIWTNDFHIAPIRDVRAFLQPMGVRFIDKNLDTFRCQQTQSCAARKSMKIINPENAEELSYSLIPKFYDAYKNDTEMQSVDAFACFHVTSLCELFEPFNKSLIIISTIRYEIGRFGKERWTKWNQNLIRYASMPWNVVAANNRYDVEYIKHFTGIQPQLIPSFCGYTNQTYNAKRKGFIIAENRDTHFMKSFLRNFTEAHKLANSSFELWPIRQKYRRYKYSDIAAHQGIVHVPYQVSVMSFFEQYRMNIPLFVPTSELLSQWVLELNAMSDRRLIWHTGWQKANAKENSKGHSFIGPHPSQHSVPDPNSMDSHAVRYWMKFCDYYHYPHVTYYKSIPELVEILSSITREDLQKTSELMKLFNVQEEENLRSTWDTILLKIAKQSFNHPH